MRRDFRRFIVCALSFAMVMGASLSASAEEAGQTDAVGTGQIERINKPESTRKPEIYQVLLPSDVNNIFDFILDPQKLIEETNAAAYGGKNFEKGSTLFFHRSDGRAAEEFSSSSDYVTIINRSNVLVDVEVNVHVVPDSLGGITMTGDRGFTDDNGASLYMALTDGERTLPIGTESTSIRTTIPAAPENAFVYRYDQENGQYIYGLRGDLEGIHFPEYSFQLTGAVNEKGDWSALGNVAPVVNVTWKVTPGQSPASSEEIHSDQNISSEESLIFKQIFETIPAESEAGGGVEKANIEVVQDREAGQDEETGQDKNAIQDEEAGQDKNVVQDEEAGQSENAVQNEDTTENKETVRNRAAEPAEKSNSELKSYTLKPGEPLSIDADLKSGNAAAVKIISVKWKETDRELLAKAENSDEVSYRDEKIIFSKELVEKCLLDMSKNSAVLVITFDDAEATKAEIVLNK